MKAARPHVPKRIKKIYAPADALRVARLHDAAPDLLAALFAACSALSDALTTHIYDLDNGDEIPADCPYAAAIVLAECAIAKAIPAGAA